MFSADKFKIKIQKRGRCYSSPFLYFSSCPAKSRILFFERIGIGIQYRVFQCFSGLGVQGVCDIFEFPVARFAAGHSDEKSVRSVNDLYVMHDETIVERDGCDGFQLAVILFYEPYPYFRNIQDCTSL